jgi:transposase
MATSHPTSLRERVVEAYESGEGSQRDLAEQYRIARSTLQNWLLRKTLTGSIEPVGHRGGRGRMVGRALLERLISELPDSTSYELTAAYNQSVPRRLRVHRSSILRELNRLGFVHKKNGYVHWSKTGPMSKQSERNFCEKSGESR